MRLLRAIALAVVLAAACGEDEQAPPPLEWTWVPVEGSVCSDGSPTGVGLERGPGESPDVFVFLMGGGACWDTLTCSGLPEFGVPPLATPGPYGEEEFHAEIEARRAGSILDRSLPGNPFKDFTFVFVPYCTGDVHAGDSVESYPFVSEPWRHRGRTNVAADLAHLAVLLETPSRVVVAGSSAGGFGALLAFDLAKATWPTARAYLVDDSGPPLAEIPRLTVEAWYARWDLGAAVDAVCGADGPACRSDLGLVFPALAARHPDDRLALLSSTRDETMRLFFGRFTAEFPFVTGMPGAEFESGLRSLAAAIEDGTPGDGTAETHAFIVAGTSHPMLDRPAAFASQGVGLLAWLRQMVEDDPGWASAIPP
jgi:hypothetical protein